MFLRGRVATADGTPIPHDVMVERVCNVGVRQQVYASSNGDFSMQLGSRADSFLDASGDRTSQSGVTAKDSTMGIPRRDLTSCELRASASGFRSDVISLVDLDVLERSIDVGVLVVQRTSKIEGTTLSATPYKAPKEARRAYEKGVGAEKNGKFANARKCFETAVEIYPRFANAWFELGKILQKENQKDAAREAYTRATTIDFKFLPPYLSLASMAYEAGNWTEVLNLTGHIVDLDPWNRANVTGYILDIDPLDYTETYFYNAVANYEVNRIEEAEKSGLKAERYFDVSGRFPQLHLLMAEIFARKNNYATAISELQTFLELAPHTKDADRVREQLAKLQKLNVSISPKQ
jgi:tetratricopeptide (TPR) repeat protein